MLQSLLDSSLSSYISNIACLILGALLAHLFNRRRDQRERKASNRQDHPFLRIENPNPVDLQSRIDMLSSLKKSEVVFISFEATSLEEDPVDQAQRDASLKPTVTFKPFKATKISLSTGTPSALRVMYIENTNSSTCTLTKIGYVFNEKTCEKNIPAKYQMLAEGKALIIVVDESSSIQISHIITDFRSQKYICKNLQDKLCTNCYFSEYSQHKE